MRLSFTLDGKPQKHTLMLSGKPLAPTPVNVKCANRLAIEIRDRIRHGTFSLAEYFPTSAAASTHDVASQLDTWLHAQRFSANINTPPPAMVWCSKTHATTLPGWTSAHFVVAIGHRH
ncbi:Arm DNA-binding domain-containing protein [Ralstonia soli]|uniref:DUF3596 domain-containing protein n=1 Tax=Ralstonia soli TaxID=2953896 RepID=A0ABT1ALL6_9RALS|nr:DUF3596 domain-containing protein [Ralstonia soli]MCO5399129.1 DUF3596 domain-containing protein [Ralstonia soli]